MSKLPHIVAVSGYKDSGKTTLCGKLLEELTRLGIRTGYIKRSSEAGVFCAADVDTKAVRKLGVDSVLWGRDGIKLESSLAADVSPSVIVSRYFPDREIVILEGGKKLTLPKIWMCSEKDETEINYPGIFIRYDKRISGVRGGVYGVGSELQIVRRLAGLVSEDAYRSASVYLGDEQLRMKGFVADFVRGGMLGMISSLKGAEEPDGDVRVFLKRGARGEKSE